MSVVSLIAKAGITYFSVVFAFGFLLGAVRVLLLSPLFGAFVAVLIELPFMLAFSWVACARIIKHFRVPKHFIKRLAIGALALTFLMSAELLLAVGFFGQNPQQFLSAIKTPGGALGLVGQGLFAIFPILQVNISQIRRATSSS